MKKVISITLEPNLYEGCKGLLKGGENFSSFVERCLAEYILNVEKGVEAEVLWDCFKVCTNILYKNFLDTNKDFNIKKKAGEE